MPVLHRLARLDVNQPNLDTKCETGLQVRLIETRKGYAGVHRHEESVNVLAAVVLVVISRDGLACGCGVAGEGDGQDIVTGGRWQDQVPVRRHDRDGLAIEGR